MTLFTSTLNPVWEWSSLVGSGSPLTFCKSRVGTQKQTFFLPLWNSSMTDLGHTQTAKNMESTSLRHRSFGMTPSTSSLQRFRALKSGLR